MQTAKNLNILCGFFSTVFLHMCIYNLNSYIVFKFAIWNSSICILPSYPMARLVKYIMSLGTDSTKTIFSLSKLASFSEGQTLPPWIIHIR